MGGVTPLGYDVMDRKLVINGPEAENVRTLFRLYRKLGTVRLLKEEADRRAIVTKRRRHRTGKETGGKPFARGNLYQLLSNPLYIGQIPHKGETYPGLHTAIINQETWAAVQDQLARKAVPRQRTTNTRAPSLLTGLVFDESGDRLCPTYACKKGRRYRYYISKRLMHEAHQHDDGWRLPAATFETAVLAPIQSLLQDQRRLIDALCIADQRPSDLIRLGQQAQRIAADLEGSDVTCQREFLQASIRRIELAASSITIQLTRRGLAKVLGIETARLDEGPDDAVTLTAPIQLRRRGVEAKLVIANPGRTRGVRDPRLCRLIVQAHRWFNQLASSETASVRAIARQENIHECDVSRNLRLAFLAPDIVEAILDGHQPVELTTETLRRLPRLPTDWESQRRLLGFVRR
jgi:hypothetical protein